jgi:hypothetical protein
MDSAIASRDSDGDTQEETSSTHSVLRKGTRAPQVHGLEGDDGQANAKDAWGDFHLADRPPVEFHLRCPIAARRLVAD